MSTGLEGGGGFFAARGRWRADSLVALAGGSNSFVSAEAEGAGGTCPLTGRTSGVDFALPGAVPSDAVCAALAAVAPLAAGATSGPACKKDRAATNATTSTPKNSAPKSSNERRERPG